MEMKSIFFCIIPAIDHKLDRQCNIDLVRSTPRSLVLQYVGGKERGRETKC